MLVSSISTSSTKSAIFESETHPLETRQLPKLTRPFPSLLAKIACPYLGKKLRTLNLWKRSDGLRCKIVGSYLAFRKCFLFFLEALPVYKSKE